MMRENKAHIIFFLSSQRDEKNVSVLSVFVTIIQYSIDINQTIGYAKK